MPAEHLSLILYITFLIPWMLNDTFPGVYCCVFVFQHVVTWKLWRKQVDEDQVVPNGCYEANRSKLVCYQNQHTAATTVCQWLQYCVSFTSLNEILVRSWCPLWRKSLLFCTMQLTPDDEKKRLSSSYKEFLSELNFFSNFWVSFSLEKSLFNQIFSKNWFSVQL